MNEYWPRYDTTIEPTGDGSYRVTASSLVLTRRTPGTHGAPSDYRHAHATGTTRRRDETAIDLLREAVYRELHRQATGTTPPVREEHTTP